MDKPKKKFWVALDGSYGFGVQTFNTDNWSEADFERVEEAHDSDRLIIAQAVDAKRKKQRLKAKQLVRRAEEVDVRWFVIDDKGVVELDPDSGFPI